MSRHLAGDALTEVAALEMSASRSSRRAERAVSGGDGHGWIKTVGAAIPNTTPSDCHGPDTPIASADDRCPRAKTVQALFDIVNRHRFVQVYGGPKTGKTTLLALLHTHIQSVCPNAEIYLSSPTVWKERRSPPCEQHLKDVVGPRGELGPTRYILLDDAHDLPWTEEMWQTVVATRPRVFTILFSRYRHDAMADTEKLVGKPVPIAEIGGRRVARHGSPLCGLYFSREEYDDLLGRMHPRPCFGDDLAEFIFKLTGGHVGTVKPIVEFIHKSGGHSMDNGVPYSLADFDRDNPSYTPLYNYLINHSSHVFEWSTSLLPYAKALDDVMLDGRIPAHADLKPSHRIHLRQAYEMGILDMADGNCVFPSPLHRALWSHRLCRERAPSPPLAYDDLLSLVQAVVSCLAPSVLTDVPPLLHRGAHGWLSREPLEHPGVSVYPPPQQEGYRLEFYRYLFDLTGGSMEMSSEFAMGKPGTPNRVDFMVPSRRWGISVTRDGNNMACADRKVDFESWCRVRGLDDHVLLDLRGPSPEYPCQGIHNLFHVAFNPNSTQYTILEISTKLKITGIFMKPSQAQIAESETDKEWWDWNRRKGSSW